MVEEVHCSKKETRDGQRDEKGLSYFAGKHTRHVPLHCYLNSLVAPSAAVEMREEDDLRAVQAKGKEKTKL